MRRRDSGWRDGRLALAHAAIGVEMGLPGMSLPMVEYDRGDALAVFNYVRRDAVLPTGADVVRAFDALGQLRTRFGTVMPVVTVQYDPRNWSMRLFAHNWPAEDLLGTAGWLPVTEEHFVRLLYRLRGRVIPPLLADYDVLLSTATWIEDSDAPFGPVDWPGQDMSARRRAYEPEGSLVPYNWRNPCADIDLGVVGGTGSLRLLVDFKLSGGYVDPSHKTHQAMSAIYADDAPVPSMIVKYHPNGEHWTFSAFCLNRSAETMLTRVLVRNEAVAPGFWPKGWTHLNRSLWEAVLAEAQQG